MAESERDLADALAKLSAEMGDLADSLSRLSHKSDDSTSATQSLIALLETNKTVLDGLTNQLRVNTAAILNLSALITERFKKRWW